MYDICNMIKGKKKSEKKFSFFPFEWTRFCRALHAREIVAWADQKDRVCASVGGSDLAHANLLKSDNEVLRYAIE